MNAVDASEHYEVSTTEESPSLLSVIIDTNPRAWEALRPSITFPEAVRNVLAFVNAHLASSNANDVTVLAAHCNRAAWLYPSAPVVRRAAGSAEDVDMPDAYPSVPPPSANKFPSFSEVEAAVESSLRKLLDGNQERDLAASTPQLSGALTMALCHINKKSQSLTSNKSNPADNRTSSTTATGVRARVLVISVSDSEPSQYIPTMNAVFAASHSQIAIDTLALSGNATFLQQASFITNGVFLAADHRQGIITYLMMGFLADAATRMNIVAPTHHTVDFRAACFCHGRVVDMAFICSICLSIFCEVPEGAECLTCGTKLKLGTYGSKPAVVPRKKKKKKRLANGNGIEDTGSASGTPRP